MHRIILGLITLAALTASTRASDPVRTVGHRPSAGCGTIPAGGCATAAPCATAPVACAPAACAPAACAPAAPACAPAPAAPCGGCDSCAKKKLVRGGHGSILSRLGAFFCYRSVKGGCDGGPACGAGCSTPLFAYFFRDCAYRPSACGHPGTDGAVNPSYTRSVFPVGHTVGAMPTGHPGGCVR
ncbi:MAG: hypothetical protein ACRC33_01695 [Gemmataceae bacterium]